MAGAILGAIGRGDDAPPRPSRPALATATATPAPAVTRPTPGAAARALAGLARPSAPAPRAHHWLQDLPDVPDGWEPTIRTD